MSNLDFMGRIAESQIQEAIEEGKFDDLPGKGKPIVFDDDPMTPPHLRMMNRILANANVLPEWIQIQKDIEVERNQIAELRRRLVRENARWGSRLTKSPTHPGSARQYSEWHAKSRAAYLRLLKSVNTSILKFTLAAPTSAPAMASFKIQTEMETFDADIPAHAVHDSAADPAPVAESSLRRVARSQYRAGQSRDSPASD